MLEIRGYKLRYKWNYEVIYPIAKSGGFEMENFDRNLHKSLSIIQRYYSSR